jgi:hypothetical protein
MLKGPVFFTDWIYNSDSSHVESHCHGGSSDFGQGWRATKVQVRSGYNLKQVMRVLVEKDVLVL